MAEKTAMAGKRVKFSGADAMLEYLRSNQMAAKDTASIILDDGRKSREMEFTRHVNPDGSRGGFVGYNVAGKRASVDNATHIDFTAIVYGSFEIMGSRIRAGASILSFGKEGQMPTGDTNVIEDSIIGDGSVMVASGLESRMVIRHSRIGSDFDMDIGRGSAYLHSAVIDDRVCVKPGAAGRLDILYFGVEESNIGSGAGIDLNTPLPRLNIVGMNVNSNALVTIDSNDRYMEVKQNGRLPNDFYTVNVPDLGNAALAAFIRDAEAFADGASLAHIVSDNLRVFAGDSATEGKLERAILLSIYVHRQIRYNPLSKSYPGDKQSIPLEYFIQNRGGVCFEYAILLYEALQGEFESGRSTARPHVAVGLAESGNVDSLHTWVEVEIDGHVFVIDPTRPMPYLIAGMREKDGTFVSFYSGSWDYMSTLGPAVKT